MKSTTVLHNNKHALALLLVVACCIGIHAAPSRAASPVQWTTGPGANGHFYEVVGSPGISWDDAQAAAIAAGGYLATITSPEENAFVFSLVNNPIYWFNDPANNSQGPWIGGFQPPGSPEPAGDWQWVNGEGPLVYSNWAAGEPDNSYPGEDRLQFFSWGLNTIAPTWNDEREAPYAAVRAYVIEIVPEPSSLFLFGLAAAAQALHKRRQRR
jgi:hypothetical protein